MKRILLALLLCTSLTLSGCAYGQTGIDGMLKPPKLSDQQNEIYAALQASVGKNITLKYPRTGDFTSAVMSIIYSPPFSPFMSKIGSPL